MVSWGSPILHGGFCLGDGAEDRVVSNCKTSVDFRQFTATECNRHDFWPTADHSERNILVTVQGLGKHGPWRQELHFWMKSWAV